MRVQAIVLLALGLLLGLLSSAQAQEERKKPFFKKGPDPKDFQDRKPGPSSSSDQVKQLQDEIDRLHQKLRAVMAATEKRDDKGPGPREPQGRLGKDERKEAPPGGRFAKGDKKGPPPRPGMAGHSERGRASAWHGKHRSSWGQHGHHAAQHGPMRHHHYAAQHGHHHGHEHASQASLSDISRKLDRLQREVEDLRHSMRRR